LHKIAGDIKAEGIARNTAISALKFSRWQAVCRQFPVFRAYLVQKLFTGYFKIFKINIDPFMRYANLPEFRL
jgi:hypothetical protein